MPKVLVVGERCHTPDLHPEKERRYAWLWDARPMKCVMTFPAFDGDSLACRRARSLFPGAHLSNLLSPQARAGGWDPKLAKFVAQLVHGWAVEKGARLALLGRRVADAFFPGGEVPLGALRAVDGVPYLTVPHPSGLCREWNDPEKVKKITGAAAEFCR